MGLEFLQEACDWFVAVKAPGLETPIFAALQCLRDGIPLTDKSKKVLAFVLFSYSMNFGPGTFFSCENTANEVGVTTEFAEWANDWINYSKSSLKK